MNKVQKLWFYVWHKPTALGVAILVRLAPLVPDKLYLKLMFRFQMGYWMDFSNPKTFCEKLQWLKLYNRKPEYTKMVDKYEAKKYVAEIIGEEYIIPTLGVWDSVDDIDFEALPEKFVLKTTHGGGGCGVIVCRDKSQLDITTCRNKLRSSLKQSIYKISREWPYKNVKPRIMAEQYMEDCSRNDLPDYKFFCFNGEVKALFVATDRGVVGEEVKFDFYDAEYNHLPLKNGHPNAKSPLQKPVGFEQMKELAAKLSVGFPHLRVDLFNINGKIYFGELTFFHFGGLVHFEPNEWDYTFGSWIKLQ